MVQTAVQWLTNAGLVPFLAVYTHTHTTEKHPVMSRSVSLIKGKNNMIGISIGGGAPLCPVLYVVQVSGTRISPTHWSPLCMSSVTLYLEPMNRSTHCTCDINLSLSHTFLFAS